ncbi:dephospho-CoA kinase [Saccharicrinis fermentans]|uniref:Dephospho-CoA kinase n=1 Tax=Saccharicrinis fermentans DSM 9555 = JCM 21142 TaxID=869213 RepID=W7XX82_9BACT|nr:dephospho-CoA kinase [Saccharicrinis fermentans]GAF03055.1 dephospho-CoA kinase [Saccharicrinis fermentans DSM 9555 = JCM 21142]
MIKVGITGGIGSGKTTVSHIFEALKVPVYCADMEARKLTDVHPDIVAGVKKLFGNDIYIDGRLDRKRVAALVFANKNLLSELNSIVHPLVKEHFNNWVKHCHAKCDYVLKEAAILFESGGNQQMDKVVTVTAPLELRIKRVMKRDGLTEKEVKDRILHQMPEQDKIRMSDYVIQCNDKDLVIPQVLQIHQLLLRQS